MLLELVVPVTTRFEVIEQALCVHLIHCVPCSTPSFDVCMDSGGDIGDKSVEKGFELSVIHLECEKVLNLRIRWIILFSICRHNPINNIIINITHRHMRTIALLLPRILLLPLQPLHHIPRIEIPNMTPRPPFSKNGTVTPVTFPATMLYFEIRSTVGIITESIFLLCLI